MCFQSCILFFPSATTIPTYLTLAYISISRIPLRYHVIPSTPVQSFLQDFESVYICFAASIQWLAVSTHESISRPNYLFSEASCFGCRFTKLFSHMSPVFRAISKHFIPPNATYSYAFLLLPWRPCGIVSCSICLYRSSMHCSLFLCYESTTMVPATRMPHLVHTISMYYSFRPMSLIVTWFCQ